MLSCKQDTPMSFVVVRGKQFYCRGRPYYFFGANFWHGAYLAADFVKGDKERLVKELDQLSESGISNLRIMASSEASDLRMSVKPAFQEGPGEYNEILLEGLDFLLTEMAKRNMKAVLVLNNYWQWSGGMSQYMNWVTGVPIIDPDKTGDWEGFQSQSAWFYSNIQANKLFRDYISMLINRINSISGQQYKNDPTIMAWQLANEPRPAPGINTNKKHLDEFDSWICQTARFIRTLDPNHLISSGNEGAGGCRNNIDIYSRSHQCQDIDYLTFHIWPKNWGWYQAQYPDSTFGTTIKNTKAYLKEHVEVAQELDKPIVLEEFGMERDLGGFSPTISTVNRDRYLEVLFGKVIDNVKSGSPLAGLNFWAWGGMPRAGSDDFIWKTGDSYIGDPPQEPQGLNSVFSSDSTTLKIFRKYNQKLKAILGTGKE
jgi:mannan endo-1,4-beta-mannosidase